MTYANPEEQKAYLAAYRKGVRRGPRPKQPALVRLLARLDREYGQENTGSIHPDGRPLGRCWEWSGARNHQGYAIIRNDKGRLERGSRIALAAALGRAIRPGMVAAHLCDNPPCCRPRHLYEGTQSDNLYDQYYRERRPRVCAANRKELDDEGAQ